LAVVAHEIGHINKYHLIKRKDSAKNLKTLSNLTALSIIGSSLITNNNDYIAESLITNQLGIQNYFQSFSRDQEREADNFSINTLNKLNLSTDPLLKFLNLLEKRSIQKGILLDYYKFSSHPIYKERYKIIQNNKKNNKKKFDNKLDTKFKFIRAKLFGFTEKNDFKLKEYLGKNYEIYAKSIILSKEGNLLDSMKLINNLIKKNKNNNFILETKADILYSNGFLREALLFYNKSLLNKNKNYYVFKRIFNIKFSLLKKENIKISEILFNEYSFLLNIFINDEDLKNKFKSLSIQTNKISWINYFSIEKKFNNKKNLYNKNFLDNIKNIKKETNDINLINLINKKIQRLNENS